MSAALVTGATSGIGRAAAERLIADGCDVPRNTEAVSAAVDAFGRLDVVVADAGGATGVPVTMDMGWSAR